MAWDIHTQKYLLCGCQPAYWDKDIGYLSAIRDFCL